MKFESRMNLEQACLIFFSLFLDDLYVSICFFYLALSFPVLRAVFRLRLS